MGDEKDRLKYGFAVYLRSAVNLPPLDKDNFEYHYPRGFDDCFTIEPDLLSNPSCNRIPAGAPPEFLSALVFSVDFKYHLCLSL